jgi:hypothetical protein
MRLRLHLTCRSNHFWSKYFPLKYSATLTRPLITGIASSGPMTVFPEISIGHCHYEIYSHAGVRWRSRDKKCAQTLPSAALTYFHCTMLGDLFKSISGTRRPAPCKLSTPGACEEKGRKKNHDSVLV